MLPASFAIPYLLTAPLPPVLSMHFVPDAGGACRPVAQACFAGARFAARNHSNRTLVLDEVYVTLSKAGLKGYQLAPDPRPAIPPFGEVTLPDVYELHVEAPQQWRFRYHAAGERNGSRTGRADTPERSPALVAAARTACQRCSGGGAEACACATTDAGRRCTRITQCQGPCLFDRFEKLPDPACTPQSMTRCPVYPPGGFRVGHCAELKVPVGCFDVLTKDDSEAVPILIPNAHHRSCFDEARLVH